MLFQWTTDNSKRSQKNLHFSELIGPMEKLFKKELFSSKVPLALTWGHEMGLNFSLHCLISVCSSQVFQMCQI